MHKTIYCRYNHAGDDDAIAVCDFNAIFNRCLFVVVLQASDYAYTGYNQSYTNPYAYYPYMTPGISSSSIASQPPQTYQLISPPTTESSFTGGGGGGGGGGGSTPSPPLKTENGNSKSWSPTPSSPADDKSDAGACCIRHTPCAIELHACTSPLERLQIARVLQYYRQTHGAF